MRPKNVQNLQIFTVWGVPSQVTVPCGMEAAARGGKQVCWTPVSRGSERDADALRISAGSAAEPASWLASKEGIQTE